MVGFEYVLDIHFQSEIDLSMIDFGDQIVDDFGMVLANVPHPEIFE